MTIVIVTGCSSNNISDSQFTEAIKEIRAAFEIPQLPLQFIECTGMINSPSGCLEVANFQDSEGRIFSVHQQTHQVVEIDARALLENRDAETPLQGENRFKNKAWKYATSIYPDFETMQSALQYEEGEKNDHYFFSWYSEMQSGLMNRPFLQFAFDKNGLLFAYYNTLSEEK